MKMKSVKIDMNVLDLDLMFVLLELAIFGSDTVNMKWKWSCFVAEKMSQRIFFNSVLLLLNPNVTVTYSLYTFLKHYYCNNPQLTTNITN